MGNLILLNNRFHSAHLKVSVFSHHFQYGQGFFETLLCEDGEIYFFKKHLERIKKTCYFFNINLDLSWVTSHKILNLIKKNDITSSSVRVKILYAPLENNEFWDICIWAQAYKRENKARSLCLHPETRDSSLYQYKSTNYYSNIYWKNFYKDKADEVLFLNNDHKILEGTISNIIYIHKKSLYYTDYQGPYLKGVTQEEVLSKAKSLGLKIHSEHNGLDIEKIIQADEVILTNSLVIAQKCSFLIDIHQKKHTLSSVGWAESFREVILFDHKDKFLKLLES